MENEDNAPGASGGETDYSLEGAANKLMAAMSDEDLTLTNTDPDDEGEGERAAAPEPESEETGDLPDDGEVLEVAEDQGDDTDKPEPTTRLRDGTEVPIAELKKAYAAQKEFEQRQSQFETRAQQFAQQEQFVNQVLPLAIATLEQQIPPEPDASLLQTDPIAHYEQTVARQAGLAKIQQLTAAQEAAKHSLAQRTQQETESYIKREQEHLFQKLPELKDTSKRRDFYEKTVLATAREYGFSDQEVNQTYDHRLIVMIRDAAAYRALQAQKPVVQKKVEQAAPMQRPGKRVSSSEQQSQARVEKFQRLRRTGSVDDAASLISDFL
jgi:hypothetical protein